MAADYDAIIIGTGVIGNAVAFELAKQGKRTLSIDKNPASGYGSTSASCAIIRTHYSTYDGAALAHEGWFYWKDWSGYLGTADERGLTEYRDIGCVVLKTEKNGNLASIIANMDKLAIPYEEWDVETMRARMPIWDTRAFSPVRTMADPAFGEASADAVNGAVFFPRAGYVSDPGLSAQNLEAAAKVHGADFRYNATVAEILKSDGRVSGVRLADGTAVSAPVVVNVAGPHSAKVNAMAGVLDGMKISTKALRQEVAHVPSPAGFDYENDGFVVSDSDIGCYSRPETGNHILIGSEDPECDPREFVDPDDYNRDFTDQWTVQVHREAQRIPTLPIPSRPRGVVDLYDVADDWIPIYDKSDLPGFYMAVGTSGNQFKNAPVAGKLMAALIAYCEGGADHDVAPLSLTLEHTGVEINVGFYSRRREINPESSFSVLG